MLIVGTLVGALAAVLGASRYAVIIGWIAAALSYTLWVWLRIRRMDSAETKSHATREDPSRGVADLLLVLASLASLGAVAFVLISASRSSGFDRVLLASSAVAAVALSWALIHTLFMLRYASAYYSGEPGSSGDPGGVDFHQDEDPTYGDFAYLAFTLGMTYQVSDTDLSSRRFRMLALQHGILSFVFGAVILATIINLIAGLGA